MCEGGRHVEGAHCAHSMVTTLSLSLSPELISKVMSEHSRAFVAIFEEAKQVLREVLPTTPLLLF